MCEWQSETERDRARERGREGERDVATARDIEIAKGLTAFRCGLAGLLRLAACHLPLATLPVTGKGKGKGKGRGGGTGTRTATAVSRINALIALIVSGQDTVQETIKMRAH